MEGFDTTVLQSLVQLITLFKRLFNKEKKKKKCTLHAFSLT